MVLNNEFHVFPNPGQNEINISFKDVADAEFKIYNSLGQLEIKVKLDSKSTKVNTGILASGIYTYQLIINNSIHHGKWIKTN